MLDQNKQNKLPNPKHMDTLSRNERIQEKLLQMGLVVIPSYNKLGSINFFWVSTGQIAPELLKGNSN